MEPLKAPKSYAQIAKECQAEIDRLTAQPDASQALLAERDGEIALLRQQSVGWVQVFDENATLRAEVERYRELLTEGLNFGKVLVATENMKAVYSWVKKVRNGLEGCGMERHYESASWDLKAASDRIKELEQQIQQARREGWEQCKKEAFEIARTTQIGQIQTTIAAMEYKETEDE